jgi:hypothetical protein
MSWEKRGSKRYYYHVYRNRGKMTHRYIGNCILAEQLPAGVAARKLLRMAAQAVRRELQSLERSVIDYTDGVSELFAA